MTSANLARGIVPGPGDGAARGTSLAAPNRARADRYVVGVAASGVAGVRVG